MHTAAVKASVFCNKHMLCVRMGWSFVLWTYCLLAACRYITAVCQINGNDCGVLLPTDPNAAIGQPLELTCTLEEEFIASTKFNSSYITFELRDESDKTIRINGMVINKTTAALYLSEVDLHYGIWDAYCAVKVTERKIKEITYQIMYVGYIPYKPVIKDVYISNWENLVVKWSIPWPNPTYVTYNTGMYSLRKKDRWIRWKKCGSRKTIKKVEHLEQECSVEQFDMNAKALRVRVNASNVVATIWSDQFNSSDLPSLVVTATVSNISASPIDKRKATIRWNSPKPQDKGLSTKVMVYEVTYCSPRNGFEKTVVIMSSNMSTVNTELTSLLPYTKYMVTVRCKSARSDRFSGNTTMSFFTEEDYPLAPPKVLQGNFEVKVKPGDMRDIVLYWQNVPVEKRNGKIQEFRITTVPQAGVLERILLKADELKGSLMTTLKNLSVTETYSFLIDARNSVGFPLTLSQTHIVVHPQSDIPDGLDASFVKLNNSSMRVLWSDTGQASSLTLYWCKGRIGYGDCQGQIQWKQVSDLSKGVEFLSDYDFGTEHMFGTSVEVNSRHSGIHWTPCVYNVKAQPLPPLYEVLHTSAHSVDFKLKPADCASSKAVIDSFVVDYCAVDSFQETTCSGDMLEATFSVSQSGEYSLKNLEPDHTYLLHVRSVSMGAQSPSTKYSVRTASKVTRKQVIGIVVGLVIVVIFSCIGVYGCYKCQYKICQKWKTPIPIAVPSDQGTDPSSDSDKVAQGDSKAPNTQLDTDDPLSIPIESTEIPPVDLHRTMSPAVPNLKSPEEDFSQPLIINPLTFHGAEHMSNSTPATSAGSSDYVATGSAKILFNSVEPHGNLDIAIMTTANMDTLAQVDEEKDHCFVPLRTGPFRKEADNSEALKGHGATLSETSFIVPPPVTTESGAHGDCASSGGTFGSDTGGITSYACAGLPSQGSSIWPLEEAKNEEVALLYQEEDFKDSGTYVTTTVSQDGAFNTPPSGLPGEPMHREHVA